MARVMSANIGAPGLYRHDRCSTTDDYSGKPGDVKRCEHGRIMYCYQSNGGVFGNMGYGAMYSFWREMSPIFEPIRYRRAKRALVVAAAEAQEARTKPICGKAVGKGGDSVYKCERAPGHDGRHWRITPPEQLPSTLTRIQGGKP